MNPRKSSGRSTSTRIVSSATWIFPFAPFAAPFGTSKDSESACHAEVIPNFSRMRAASWSVFSRAAALPMGFLRLTSMVLIPIRIAHPGPRAKPPRTPHQPLHRGSDARAASLAAAHASASPRASSGSAFARAHASRCSASTSRCAARSSSGIDVSTQRRYVATNASHTATPIGPSTSAAGAAALAGADAITPSNAFTGAAATTTAATSGAGSGRPHAAIIIITDHKRYDLRIGAPARSTRRPTSLVPAAPVEHTLALARIVGMSRLTARAALLAVTAVLLLPSRPVDACENEVERVVDLVAQSIRRAEGSLADGSFHAAARDVLATFPAATQASHRERRQALFHRGQRILALAVVRSGGAVALGPSLSGRTPEQRAAKLAWAATILRLHAARTGDVQVRAELAEALARIPLERAGARAILRELADADILPTARAWALLADLEREHGDDTYAARATRRCREIAPDSPLCPATTSAA